MSKWSFLCFIFLLNAAVAQKEALLHGVVENYYGRSISLDLPNNGLAVAGNKYQLPVVDLDDVYSLNGNPSLTKDGVVGFYHFGTSSYVRLWLSTSGVNQVELDWEKPKRASRFSGVTQKENELLTKLDLDRDNLLKTNTAFDWDQIMRFQRTEQGLLKNTTITSEAFVRYMTKDIYYYWLYFAQKKGLDVKGRVSEDDLNDSISLGNRNYLYFLHEYFSNGSKNLKSKYEVIQNTINNERVRSAFWAFDLYEESTKEKVDYDIIREYYHFKELVNSTWLHKLAYTHIALIEDEYKVINTAITDEMVIYEEPMAFQDMLDQFKGKVIYLDVWATWCGPCIEEMKPRYKDPLFEFIKNKDVKVVYFSVDAESASEKWKKKAKDMRLNSFNIRFPDYRLTDAFNILGMDSGKPYTIPRYYIFNKQGELVNANAPRPSEGQKLYAELAKYL